MAKPPGGDTRESSMAALVLTDYGDLVSAIAEAAAKIPKLRAFAVSARHTVPAALVLKVFRTASEEAEEIAFPCYLNMCTTEKNALGWLVESGVREKFGPLVDETHDDSGSKTSDNA